MSLFLPSALHSATLADDRKCLLGKCLTIATDALLDRKELCYLPIWWENMIPRNEKAILYQKGHLCSYFLSYWPGRQCHQVKGPQNWRDPNFISNSTIYSLCSFRKLFILCFLLVLEIPIFLVSPVMQQKWVLVELYARSSCEGALENIIPNCSGSNI